MTNKDAHHVIYLHTVWPRPVLLRLRLQRPHSCVEFCLRKLSPEFLRWRHVCLIDLACLVMSIYTRRVWFTQASRATPCHDQWWYVTVGMEIMKLLDLEVLYLQLDVQRLSLSYARLLRWLGGTSVPLIHNHNPDINCVKLDTNYWCDIS